MSIRHRHPPKPERNPGSRCPRRIAYRQAVGTTRYTRFRGRGLGTSWEAERLGVRPIRTRWPNRAGAVRALLVKAAASLQEGDCLRCIGREVADRNAESPILFIQRIITVFVDSAAWPKQGPGGGTVNQGGAGACPITPSGLVLTAWSTRALRATGGARCHLVGSVGRPC